MRFPTLLILTGLLITQAHADDATGSDITQPTSSTSAPVTAYDPAAIHTQMQQRREAWRALTPEQRQARLQSGRSQAQTLHMQRNVQ